MWQSSGQTGWPKSRSWFKLSINKRSTTWRLIHSALQNKKIYPHDPHICTAHGSTHAAYHVGVDEWHHQMWSYSNERHIQHRKDLNAQTGPGASADADGSKCDLPEEKSDSLTCTHISPLSQQHWIIAGLCSRRCVQSLHRSSGVNEATIKNTGCTTHTHTRLHKCDRKRGAKKEKEMCLLTHLAIFSPFLFLRSSLQWRHEAPLCSRPAEDDQERHR